MTLYSTAQAADTLGCSRSTVTRAAKRLGIGRRHGALLAFTAADLRRLRAAIADGPGNPAWLAAADALAASAEARRADRARRERRCLLREALAHRLRVVAAAADGDWYWVARGVEPLDGDTCWPPAKRDAVARWGRATPEAVTEAGRLADALATLRGRAVPGGRYEVVPFARGSMAVAGEVLAFADERDACDWLALAHEPDPTCGYVAQVMDRKAVIVYQRGR